jgi:phosphonate transport system substrate-binding protein
MAQRKSCNRFNSLLVRLVHRKSRKCSRQAGRDFLRGVLAMLACMVSCLAIAPAAMAADEYSFAVVPQFEQRKLFTIWKPIIDELEKRTQLHLKLVTTLTIPEFERELGKGSFDFAYTNPYQIMREGSRHGYIPLVRDETPQRGILLVLKDSPIHKLDELNGKTLAVPSPNALGASLLLQADLEHLHHVKMKLLNAKSHSSVYLHVVNGLVDAGGGVEKTLQEQPPQIRDALRVLYTTRDFPSHPVSAHPRVPAEVQNKLRAALLELGTTPEGAALLAKVPMSRVKETSIQDYQPIATWGLEAFWVEGVQ